MRKSIALTILILFIWGCSKPIPEPELKLPELSTSSVTEFTSTSAKLGGNVSNVGNPEYTERGVCIGTNPTPTEKTPISGKGMGEFSTTLTNLTPTTKYYVRAYAINSQGTAYGKEVTFTTSDATRLPELITSEPSEITPTSAKLGGNISNAGNPEYTERGICIGTTSAPTTKTEVSGTGTGEFSVTISDLNPGTKYYVRAYAENSEGISYGAEITFTTGNSGPSMEEMFPDPVFREIVMQFDSDGNGTLSEKEMNDVYIIELQEYRENKIRSLEGIQYFKEIRVLILMNSEITSLDLSGNRYIRDITIYENALLKSVVLPESNEIETLSIQKCDLSTLDFIPASTHLKGLYIDNNTRLTSIDLSKYPNLTNFQAVGTSIEILDISPITTKLDSFFPPVSLQYLIMRKGQDVYLRFAEVRNPIIELVQGEIATFNIVCQSNNGAEVQSYVASLDGNITERGICWNTSPNPTINNNKIESGSGTGGFKNTIASLAIGNKYYIRSYAKSGTSVVYSDDTVVDRIDYTNDGVVTRLQSATKGSGIDLIFMGDGFTSTDVANGTYRKEMEKALDIFFSSEPAKSLRDYFNAYMVTTVSASNDFINGGTALEVTFGNITYIGGNYLKVIKYAEKTGVDLSKAVISVTAKPYDSRLNGTCHYLASGLSITYTHCENEEQFAKTLVHEALGHGFAHLADEYDGYEPGSTIDPVNASVMRNEQKRGWWANVDFTDNLEEILWKEFIGDAKYSYVGAYEGGAAYYKGVWRPEEDSCMRSNIMYFNAPSRYAIYRRVMELAGESYSFESFKAQDNVTPPATTSSSTTKAATVRHHQPPVFVENR